MARYRRKPTWGEISLYPVTTLSTCSTRRYDAGLSVRLHIVVYYRCRASGETRPVVVSNANSNVRFAAVELMSIRFTIYGYETVLLPRASRSQNQLAMNELTNLTTALPFNCVTSPSRFFPGDYSGLLFRFVLFFNPLYTQIYYFLLATSFLRKSALWKFTLVNFLTSWLWIRISTIWLISFSLLSLLSPGTYNFTKFEEIWNIFSSMRKRIFLKDHE